jgi:predicted small integral membrane protein
MDGMDLADGRLLRHHRAHAGGHGHLGMARPGGSPRVGILRFETTRGDRLFVSLLGSAFINLAWLGLVGPELWWSLALSVVYAICVFRFV